MEDLPADYASETRCAAQERFRDSATAEWQIETLNLQRTDQAIASPGRTAIVQGNTYLYTESGAVLFENTGLYGVDRRTRANVTGYGDTNREGQYLFPPHVRQGTYTLWDPMFIGPRVATFDHTEALDGLPVYVFHFSGTGMDETAGYSYLADVPEHYQAHTDGQGTMWIEPASGVVVEYQEQGNSYFVDRATGKQVADFNQWTNRYVPETRVAQRQLALATRQRILLLEDWLPGGLIAVGLIWLAVGLWVGRRSARNGGPL
jgi:hypothetical protein